MKYNQKEDLMVRILEGSKEHYGGNQYWYRNKRHQLSGCGPVAAANLAAYMAFGKPEQYGDLYSYSTRKFDKMEYINHMTEVRKYVIPGMFGLTSVVQFAEQLIRYGKTKGVELTPYFFKKDQSQETAWEYIQKGLRLGQPIALLILTHSAPVIDDYTWHWMTISNCYTDVITEKRFLVISTWGEKRILDFDILWNERRRFDVIKLVYFR